GGTLQATATGKPNLRRAPALVNIAWHKELGWDGRYASITEQLPPHIKGQLGDDLAAAVARIADLPLYRAHFARSGGPDAALTALAAYVLTRYAGDAPWDREERSPSARRPPRGGADAGETATGLADVKAGYQLFNAKAQCAVCHTPPLYTDLRYHRLG